MKQRPTQSNLRGLLAAMTPSRGKLFVLALFLIIPFLQERTSSESGAITTAVYTPGQLWVLYLYFADLIPWLQISGLIVMVYLGICLANFIIFADVRRKLQSPITN